ncbi:ABHD17C-like protein [Tanacetum coccineum]
MFENGLILAGHLRTAIELQISSSSKKGKLAKFAAMVTSQLNGARAPSPCPSAVRNVKLHCLADSTNNDHEDEYVRQTNPSSSTRRKSSTERNVRPWSVADRVVPATEVLVVEIHVLVKTAREPVLFITKSPNYNPLAIGGNLEFLCCNILSNNVVWMKWLFHHYDYSGYGASTGKPSEFNTYYDIEAVYNCLKNNYGTKQEDLILYGQSVGSGPTLHLAFRLQRLKGIVLHSELEKDAVTLLKRIRKFSVAQDNRAHVAVYIFSRISFVITKRVKPQIVSQFHTNFL